MLFVLSIILFSNLEEALRMIAYGTDLRSLLTDNEMTAVAAFPHRLFALFKYLLHLDVVEKSAVSFFVVLSRENLRLATSTLTLLL